MRISLKSVTAGVTTLAVAGVMAVAGATGAAAAPPPYDPDGDAYGTLTFYNAAGVVVTSGDASNPESIKYAVASTDPTSPVTIKRAATYLYTPVAGTPAGNWTGTQLSGNTLYPIAAAPAVVSSSTFPAAATVAAAVSMKDAAVAVPQLTTGVLANVYQVRLKSFNVPDYASASITIDPVTNVWTQVFPVPVTNTTTALAVSPASPATAPASPTLTATVTTGPPATPAAAGTVQFFDGTTPLGAPVAVAGGTATKALTGVAAGSYSYKATFTPTDPTVFGSSSSGVVPFLAEAPLPTPTIGLSSSSSAPDLGAAVTFTASFSGLLAPAGTFEFFDGATSLAPAGAATTLTTSTLALGIHSVTAKFVPTDTAAFRGATSPPVSVNVLRVLAGACTLLGSACTDPQGFKVEVPQGTLVISTPYTPINPFNLGTMVLNSTATELSTGPVLFGSATSQADGVTITDQRSGDLPWTANLQSSAFTSGVSNIINARNLGFTEVTPHYIPGNALGLAKPVLTFDNAATTPAVGPLETATTTGLASEKKFASALNGAGTVYVGGNFKLNAPTSTPAGTYVGTVTFTII